jgi:hypothetical protein
MTRPLEEDAPARTRHAAEAFLERLPEAALVESGFRIAPRLRRLAPMAGLIEERVEPRGILTLAAEIRALEVRAIAHGAALQVDHLETQDRGEPCAHQIRTVAFDFRVSGIGDELNLGLHPLYW